MYRELGSLDAFGVRGGPYTGTPRLFGWHELPETVRENLRRCLAREQLPSPLLTATGFRPGRALIEVLTVVCGALSVLLLVLGNWLWPLPVCVGVGVLIGRRVVRRLPPSGVYLFPLDIVELAGASLRVVPLGSLRSAGVRHETNRSTLELRFEHGAYYVFACANEAAAERAYDKIREAHEAVERLTFGTDLEETVDLDPLFAIRETAAWVSASDRKVAPSNPRGWLLPAAAGLVVGAFGAAGMWAHADGERYARALADGHPERYLAEGGWLRRAKAEQAIELQRQLAARKAEHAEADDGSTLPPPSVPRIAVAWSHKADAELEPAAVEARNAAQRAALRAYRQQTGGAPLPHDIQMEARLEQMFAATRARGEDNLYVRFRTQHDRDQLCADCSYLTARFMQVFSRIFSETIPMSVVVVSTTDMSDLEATPLVLDIEEQLQETASGLAFHFRAGALAFGKPVGEAFSLDLRAPAKPLTSLRRLSIFTRDGRFQSDSTPEPRLLAARAYDRLYDEVYGMFFAGNPRVPVFEPSFGAPETSTRVPHEEDLR